MLLEVIEEMLTLIGGLIVAYFVYVLIARRDDKPTTDPPTMAHTALRDIVERAVEEARKLPGLGSSDEAERAQEGRNVAEHSYEDLLATAILNKVIEKFQREQVDGNSNVLPEKLTARTKCIISENELGLDEGVEEGCSSLEPLSQDECSSDCSASCSRHLRNQPERLSLTIEERIEEVTTTYTSDEEHRDNDVLAIRNTHRVPFPELGMDIIDPSQDSSEDSQDESETPTGHVDLISPVESWEENWLFQKKRVQVQADPVAMLVPNSSADFKALIGDKDAEDTSDLSECSSAQSDEEIEKELQEAINNVVPRTPDKKEFDEIRLDNHLKTFNGFESNTNVTNNSAKESDVELQKVRSNVPEGRSTDKKIESPEKIDPQVFNETKVKGEESKACKNAENENQKTATHRECLETNVHRKSTESAEYSLCVSTESKTKEIGVSSDERNLETKSEHHSSITTREKSNVVECAEVKSKEFTSSTFNIVNEDVQKTEKEFDTLFKEIMTEKNAKDLYDLKSDTIVETLKEEVTLEKSSAKSMESSSILLEDNVVSDAPKTPACTPTRTSLTESIFESIDDAESFISNEEIVLNSLECAKKKLMVVDENSADAFKDEETKTSVHHKDDFHGEDAQQESEYTEHYDIATQRHLDSLTKIESFSKENEMIDETHYQIVTSEVTLMEREERKCREAVAFAKAESASYLSLQNKKSEEEVQFATPPRPGTIAEREHKKWENAPPIENNPYSEESIQKRLWERQYARRLSDIPGIHTELPKSNGADLDVILTPQEPDIKRFSRDYYINNSKAASGEKGRRSATSISSRPSSSLSQRSSSTGVEQEQQVSFELEKFEEASLRGSLSRWSYLDPQSSPHFAINPLPRLELDETSKSSEAAHRAEEGSLIERSLPEEKCEYFERDSSRVDDIGKSAELPFERKTISENFIMFSKEEGSFEMMGKSMSEDIPEITADSWSQSNDVETTSGSFEFQENLSFAFSDSNRSSSNPLFETERVFLQLPERSNPDRDSGMYSIESNDTEITRDKEQSRECWKRLSWMGNDNHSHSDAKENQILSFNGKRYWNTGNYKYHTFGGIRSFGQPSVIDDFEEDNARDETSDELPVFHTSDFSNLKFQTFGGIKRSGRIDGRGIPTYRKIKLRPSLQAFRHQRRKSKSSDDDYALRKKRSADVQNYDENVKMKRKVSLDMLSMEDDDWQDENHESYVSSPIPKDTSSTHRNRSFSSKPQSKRSKRKYSKSYKKYFRTLSSSSCQSSADDWEDDDTRVSDEAIMSKFLKDASKRTMSHISAENRSTYSLNTSRKRTSIPQTNTRKLKVTKTRCTSDENESLKLEPPIVPKIVERTFETLKDLRNSERVKKKYKDSSTGKKMGVRSLSDVTIW